MTDERHSDAPNRKKAEREARLAAALRENLKKRKAQDRARKAENPASEDESGA